MKNLKVAKQFILPLFMLAIIAGIMFTAFAENDSDASEDILWSYSAYGDGVQLTAYHGTQTDVYIPASIEDAQGNKLAVIKLGDGLFKGNTAINSATLGEGIAEIGASAFEGATNLVCVVTPQSLATIGDNAFAGCTAFNSIILYDTVTNIADTAFTGCSALTIYCNENNAGYNHAVSFNIPYILLSGDAQPEIYVENDIEYYIMNGEAIIMSCPDDKEGEIEIPATIKNYPVTKVNAAAFSASASITKVALPGTIINIGNNAFYGCTKLAEINIPEGITYIADSAFAYSGLTSAVLPDGILTIGGSAFRNCTKLTTVHIPEGVTNIYGYAFYGSGLTEATVPYSTVAIDGYSFGNCTSMRQVTILNCNTAVRAYAFAGTYGMNSIIVPQGLNNVDTRYAFSSCTSLKNVYISDLEAWCNNSFKIQINSTGSPNLTNLYLNGELLTDLVIPESVTSIKTEAFTYCKSIKKVTIHNKVTSIGSKAFFHCDNLTDVVLSASVSKIEPYAFWYDSNIQNVYTDDFEKWCNISFTDAFSNPLNYSRNFYVNGELKSDLVIPDVVSEIKSYVFVGPWLKSLTIPNSVTSIDNYAFMNCSSLSKVEFPNSITSIGAYAFSGCSRLTEMIIPDSVTSIGASAFRGCTGLTNIVLSNSITEIPNALFMDCTSLLEINMSDNITIVGSNAFYNCTALKNITMSNNIAKIGDRAFAKCTGIENVYVNDFDDWCNISFYDYYSNPLMYADNFYAKGELMNDLIIPENMTAIPAVALCGEWLKACNFMMV